jgi:hypothetical protein
MARSLVLVCLLLAAAAAAGTTQAAAQSASPIAGVWTLNRSLSEFPKEIGFTLHGLPPPDSDGAGAPASSGRGGRRNGGGGGGGRTPSPFGRPESYEDARRLQVLMGEIRTPPARLMIVDTPSAVTFTNELGQSRTLHPTGRDEGVEFQGISLTAVTRRDGDKLIVLFHVEAKRDVRYTFEPSANAAGPARLSVEVELFENGEAGDKATRLYDSGAGEPAAATKNVESVPPAPPNTPPGAGQPASGGQQPAGGSFDQRPGAEFKGLKNLGILVEDFDGEAIACGLKHDVIEDALAKRLTAGGLAVRRNSDEDTYLYVNVITTSMPNGTCVSRYDAFFYTHATARLAYREQPVLAQVSLMHRGGIGASTVAGHAAAVTRGLEGYVDLFLSQIRDANK